MDELDDGQRIELARINESALIGACLRDGSIFPQAREIVSSGDFYSHALKWAWEAMERLCDSGMGIDTITVGDELERDGKLSDFSAGMWSGLAYLSQLRTQGEPKNILSYAENVQDLAVKRKLDPFFVKCNYWSKNGRRAKDILKDINTELGKIVLYSSQDEYTVPISIAASEAYDWTDNASQGKVVGVPTGLVDIDKIFGNLYGGNVYLVAGRPGQGKTAFVLTIAKNAAKKFGKKVAVFSLEMSRAQVAQRLISQEAEVDLNRITKGKMEPDEWERYTPSVELIAGLPIMINDLSSINIHQIRQTSRKLKPDLVIVDYIQLAESGEKSRERRELDVSAVSRGLKYLARELDVPVLAAAQLSRAVEQRSDKRPILSDLRESGSLEQDSYGVMFLYKPNDLDNLIEVIVAKHRNGPVGTAELIFKGEFTRFDNAVTRLFSTRLP